MTRIEVERDTAVATLWLNRPDKRNAMDGALVQELSAALDRTSERRHAE
jgi:enoyl-CoA hydratase/carnithine racemase